MTGRPASDGIVEYLDRREEGVHVDMQNAWGVRGEVTHRA